MGNREAALALHLSEATVKRHLANLYLKLGVHSRTEAVRATLSAGWLDVDKIFGGTSESMDPAEAATRWRCAAMGCGCGVVMVRGSGSPSSWRPFVCHGLPMGPVSRTNGRGG